MNTLRTQLVRPPCGLRLVVAPVPRPDEYVIARTETPKFVILRMEPGTDAETLVDHARKFMRSWEFKTWVYALDPNSDITALQGPDPWSATPDWLRRLPVTPPNVPYPLRLPHCSYT